MADVERSISISHTIAMPMPAIHTKVKLTFTSGRVCRRERGGTAGRRILAYDANRRAGVGVPG